MISQTHGNSKRNSKKTYYSIDTLNAFRKKKLTLKMSDFLKF